MIQRRLAKWIRSKIKKFYNSFTLCVKFQKRMLFNFSFIFYPTKLYFIITSEKQNGNAYIPSTTENRLENRLENIPFL